MRNGIPSFASFLAVTVPIFLAMPGMAQGIDYDIETIALSGDPAPDVVGGTFSATFRAPDLNDAGDVAFRAGLEQDPDLTGVWVGPPGNLRLVALSGDEPPGAPGREFIAFFSLHLNEAGEVAFEALLDHSQPFNNGIWAGAPGALAAVARGGELAPDAGPRTFRGFSQTASPSTPFDPVINNFGEVVITGFLDASDTTNDEGIWAGLPGTISLVARKGDVAPNTAAVFRATRNPDLNDSGEMVFRGTLETDPVTVGLWFGTLGAMTALALVDDPAPGAPGRTFSVFGSHAYLNNAGEVAFRAFLDPSSIGDDQGIWAGTPGSLQLLVREGDPAPGTSETFTTLTHVVLNEAGGIAFYGELNVADTAINEGIWAGQGGDIQLVAREGMEAPGAPGRTFGRLISVRPALNDLGQVAFAVNLDASDTSNNQGVWVGVPGSLQLLVRSGDVLEVRPGDFRTVTSALLLGDRVTDSGRQTGFNASGQVALEIRFADGSRGILLATELAPPVAVDDLLLLPKGRTVTADLLANDQDLFGTGLTIVLVGTPSNGTASLNPDGTVTYRRDSSFRSGCDEFDYTIEDGRGSQATATAFVKVGEFSPCGPPQPNTPPVANNDSYTMTEGDSLTVAAPGVLGNDSDADGDPLTASLVSAPAVGVFVLNPDGGFTYTPPVSFVGEIDFTYTANDGTADSNWATVTVDVQLIGGGFSLTATGYKVKGLQKVDLDWQGATGTNVDIFRDGVKIATTANDGFHTDDIDQRGGGSYGYQVCEENSVTACSNQTTVTF